jgi:hypothetical protein
LFAIINPYAKPLNPALAVELPVYPVPAPVLLEPPNKPLINGWFNILRAVETPSNALG